MIAGILCIGLALIVSALKGTEHELGQQLQGDVLGSGGFLPWAGAIMAIGCIGYVPGLRSPSHYLLALLFVVLVLRNGGVWAQAEAGLQQASIAGPAPSQIVPAAAVAATSGGSSGGSSLGGIASAVGAVASIAAFL